ncbi:PaREP1 family protein [Pyrolobus fumarii]|uniref:PaREP1 family protein n=1 Tax=Pyrolobus fumarii TaxID=54252 RepID=UPI001FCB9917|nr:PaREP1 family protein [Pyrolobus fumarii]
MLLVTVINIPGRLPEAIRRRGFDPESFIIEAVEEKLGLDPREELEARVAVAEHMLRRARDVLEKGDAVQASEKLYKAVEECIKVLACLEGLEECRRAREEGGGWSGLLARAASRLSRVLGEQLVIQAWEAGYNLHVHGFHEHAFDPEDVKQRLPLIEGLVEYTRSRLREKKRGEPGRR